MATHRLFFALWPDDNSRRALATEAQRLAPCCGGYPLPAANMHITLGFLGGVDDVRAEALAALVRDWPSVQGEWRLDALGHFPQPHIVWAGSHAPDPTLSAHHAELWQALSRYGFSPPQRSFTPHVSLVRKAERPAPAGALSAPVVWRYDHLALVESRRHGENSYYRTLSRTNVSSHEG